MEEQKKKKKDEKEQEEKVGKDEEKEEKETQNDTSEPQVDGLNGVYPWDQDLIVAHTYLMTIYTQGAMHYSKHKYRKYAIHREKYILLHNNKTVWSAYDLAKGGSIV